MKRGLTVKWRVFSKCSLDPRCDTLTAGLLTVYTEGKQLGIGVSCLWVTRCSINHAGPANKASPSRGPTLHPPARKEGWMKTSKEDRHPDIEGHNILPQQQGWPGSSWGYLEPDNWKVSYSKGWTSFSCEMFVKAVFITICCKTGHWYMHWALEETRAPPSSMRNLHRYYPAYTSRCNLKKCACREQVIFSLCSGAT